MIEHVPASPLWPKLLNNGTFQYPECVHCHLEKIGCYISRILLSHAALTGAYATGMNWTLTVFFLSALQNGLRSSQSTCGNSCRRWLSSTASLPARAVALLSRPPRPRWIWPWSSGSTTRSWPCSCSRLDGPLVCLFLCLFVCLCRVACLSHCLSSCFHMSACLNQGHMYLPFLMRLW